MEECEAAIDVARILHKEEKDFRIITPYDAQRSEVETALKRSGLPWAEKVFNVDSFQGPSTAHTARARRADAAQATRRRTSSSPSCARRRLGFCTTSAGRT